MYGDGSRAAHYYKDMAVVAGLTQQTFLTWRHSTTTKTWWWWRVLPSRHSWHGDIALPQRHGSGGGSYPADIPDMKTDGVVVWVKETLGLEERGKAPLKDTRKNLEPHPTSFWCIAKIDIAYYVSICRISNEIRSVSLGLELVPFLLIFLYMGHSVKMSTNMKQIWNTH